MSNVLDGDIWGEVIRLGWAPSEMSDISDSVLDTIVREAFFLNGWDPFEMSSFLDYV